MYLIVGLGNPGEKYTKTRHNVGFMVLDTFVTEHSWQWKHIKRHEASVAVGAIGGKQVTLLKPQTFMNLSGKAVASYCSYFSILPESILVVYDDVAIPFGTLRLREKGSAGGHNGVQDILSALGTDNVARLRVGVKGEFMDSYSLVDYVLQSFSTTEQKVLPRVIDEATKAMCSVLTNGIVSVPGTISLDGLAESLL
jgi:PTH1 family peptidyl-tRNA hydrolase